MSLDLAEVVEDLICTFEGSGDTTMDTLAMFVFGWILAALFVLWIGKFIYGVISAKWTERQQKIEAAKSSPSADSVDSKKVSVVKSNSVKASPSPRSSGGYVPPTPPVRKRLTRASPGPELRKPVKYVPAPQCTGPDNICVLWVNDIFQWLYNDHVVVYELLDCWIRSLNEHMKKTALDQGITVELIRLIPETNPPVIGNVFAECDSKDDVTITCDCEATPAFQLKSLRQKDDKTETSHFRINVNRFRARLNIFCVTEKLLADVKCDGWPEIKVALAPVGNIKNNLDETHLQEVISDIFVNALRNTEVQLNLAQYSQCPKLIRHIEMPGQFLPVHYDSMNKAYTSTPNHVITPDSPMVNPSGKRLLVKVVRASQLGGTQGCKDPYCVIEMDEPSQKNQTSVQKSTDSPLWDEHFLLDVTNNTSEIMFEVYDHSTSPHRFLGLGIVGVDELLVNPSQRQIISLQGRPYESDPVSGTLTLEFMFIEGADIPFLEGSKPYKIKETIPNPIVPRNVNTSSSSPSFRHDVNLMNGSYSSESPTHRDYGLNGPDNSTIIIHSIQKKPSQRIVKVELADGVWKELGVKGEEEMDEEEKKKAIDDSGIFTNGDASNGKILSESALLDTDANTTAETDKPEQSTDRSPVTGVLPNTSDEPPPPEFRGRSKKRRDFFGTIRRRLGKSKNRSKSAGPENDVGRDDSLNRSVSADRSQNDGYRLNLPGQRSLEESSRRSSISEASGLSTASGRTYINEASTLVLETMENGIKKHYLVPLSLAQKSKWRKKGTKLHIFNDHTFIAKHLSGSTTCQVCMKSIARRIGKQGYECRDCQMKCHKHCHVKVNDNCPTSTIHNIELSYITNPYTDKNLRIL